MGAPKGNKNGKGVKGRSGRKSKFQELADAQALHSMYFGVQNQDEIEENIRKGKFSIRDRHLLNAMEGDQRAINPMFERIFPQKMELTGKDGKDLLEPTERLKKLADKLNK